MLIFEQIRTGGDRNFGYLIGDREAGKAVLIDPSFDPKKMVRRARAQGLTVTHIINTHGHRDHTNGNAKARKLTAALLVAHRGAASKPDLVLDHRRELQVGGLTLRFLFTPGHAEAGFETGDSSGYDSGGADRPISYSEDSLSILADQTVCFSPWCSNPTPTRMGMRSSVA